MGKEADNRTIAENALAFACGRDIFLGRSIDPYGNFGRRVLLHEVTHVVQQERGRAGLPLASHANLEGEAGALSGVGASGTTGGGAAVPGSVQALTQEEAKGAPTSQAQDEEWAAEFARDEDRLVAILTSLWYSEDNEAEVITILQRWARRRTQAVIDAGFGTRSDLLDRLFERLRRTRVWTLTGPTTAYEAIFKEFGRAQDVRNIRDASSISYVGREEAVDEAREEKKQEDLFAESGGIYGWRANRIYAATPAKKSGEDLARAVLVAKHIQMLRPEQHTPATLLLQTGLDREGVDFLLRRSHVLSAGDRFRVVKGLAVGAVVTMLEFAAWEVGFAAARAFGPKILRMLVGAEEIAGAESALAESGGLATGAEIESLATKAGESEGATLSELKASKSGTTLTSPETLSTGGKIESLGMKAGETESVALSELKASKSGETLTNAEEALSSAEPIEDVLQPTVTPPAEQPKGVFEKGVELPEASAELPLESTSHPAVGEVEVRGIYGKQPGRARPGQHTVPEGMTGESLTTEGALELPKADPEATFESHRFDTPRERASTSKFLNDELKKLSDPSDPLHFLVEPVGVTPEGELIYDWRKTLIETKKGPRLGRYPGNEKGVVMQVGHPTAFSTGTGEAYMLEDAELNIELSGATIETKRAYSLKESVMIGGHRVDLASALHWKRLGLLPGVDVASLTRIPARLR
jgi:hypothetical protein